MATVQDFTVRTRDEMFSIYTSYQALQRRIQDMTDEVAALGGAAAIYGAAGINWPEQADGFTYANMTGAFTAITTLIGVPTLAQKQAVIKARR